MSGDFIKRFMGVKDWKDVKEGELQNFIKSGLQENMNLEFKGKEYINGKENKIGKAISGFANSDGGLLIIGLSESKDDDPPKPGVLEPMTITKEDCQNILFNYAKPWPEKTIIHPVDLAQSGRIFLVDVPGDVYPPVQEARGGAYYTRINFQNVPMPHHLVERAFGKRLKPMLEPRAYLMGVKLPQGDDLMIEATIRLALGNNGPVAATQPAIIIAVGDEKLPMEAYNEGNELMMKYSPGNNLNGTWPTMSQNIPIPIYAGMFKNAGTIRFRIVAPNCLDISVACIEAPVETYTLELSEELLMGYIYEEKKTAMGRLVNGNLPFPPKRIPLKLNETQDVREYR